MTSKNKARGNIVEVETVKAFEKAAKGTHSRRAWGSNGKALGHHEEVDVLVKYHETSDVSDPAKFEYEGELKIQCKRKKALPSWLGFTEHVDCVVTREDRGDLFIMFKLEDFIRRFL